MTTAKQGKLAALPLDQIVIDPRLQMRDGGLDDNHVADLAEVLKAGKKLPPGRVRTVDGRHYLTDGFHTHAAHNRANKEEMRVTIRPGTRDDAVLDAAAANQQHGLKRTGADKRRAVQMLLGACPAWSNRRIATHVGVSDHFVGDVRRAHSDDGQLRSDRSSPSSEDKTVGADGRARGPRHEAPRRLPAPSPPPATGVQADDPRGMPLDDFLGADDHVWEAIHTARISTAGELYDRLRAGDTLGLAPGDVADLLAEVSNLLAPTDPPAGPKPTRSPPPAGPPPPLAELAAEVTRLAGKLTSAMKATGEKAKRLHDYLSYAGLVDHQAGEVINATMAEGDGRRESGLSFLPLRGVRHLIEEADKSGPKRTEAEIKKLHDKVSGGWLPPLIARRRRERRR